MTQRPTEILADRIIELCRVAAGNSVGRLNRTPIDIDQDAEVFFDAFGNYCDAEINRSSNEGCRLMWERAHQKALRIAANLAASDNCRLPIINIAHATWAHDLALRDIAIISRHISDARVAGKEPLHRGS